MAPSERTNLPVAFQKFRSKDGTLLRSVQLHVGTDTNKQYLLWSDVRNAFQDVSHLKTAYNKKVLFAIGNDGELYIVLFAVCGSCVS